MTTLVTVSGAPAGTGNRYLAVLTFAAKAVGTYAVNNANFAGLGVFLPGLLAIATGTPANVTLVISDGTANKQIYGAGGGVIWADGVVGGVGTGAGTQVAGAVKLIIATAATDIIIFPMGA